MALDQVVDRPKDLFNVADVRYSFGDPLEIEGRTVIPVGCVGIGAGFGGAQGKVPAGSGDGPATEGDAGGGGGCAKVRPVAVVEVVSGEVRVTPIVDHTRLAVLKIAFAAWCVFWAARLLLKLFKRKRWGR